MQTYVRCQHLPARGTAAAALLLPPSTHVCRANTSKGGKPCLSAGGSSSAGQLLTGPQHSTQRAAVARARPNNRARSLPNRPMTKAAAAAAAAVIAVPVPTAAGVPSAGSVLSTGLLQQRKRHVVVAAAGPGAGKGGSSGEDEIWQHLSQMADKYLFASGPTPRGTSSSSSSSSSNRTLPIQAIHVVLCCYVAVWLVSAVPVSSSGPLIPLKHLSLDYISSSSSSSSSSWLARLACPFTDAFSSSSGGLLARNLFLGYMFGRVVENTESSGALWLTFLLSALGGSFACLALLPRRAPLQGCAATAALFGLFSAATAFNRHKHWHWQRVFELLVLLPFTLQQMICGHQGLTQWCSLMGFRLPGAWVPLLGGVLGAAAASGVLALVRALLEGVAAQRRQQQQQQQRQAGISREGGGGEVPMSVLLARAAAQLFRKKLGY